jgi:hypothetical protein
MNPKLLASSFVLGFLIVFSGCASAGSKALYKETELSVAQKLTEGQWACLEKMDSGFRPL